MADQNSGGFHESTRSTVSVPTKAGGCFHRDIHCSQEASAEARADPPQHRAQSAYLDIPPEEKNRWELRLIVEHKVTLVYISFHFRQYL